MFWATQEIDVTVGPKGFSFRLNNRRFGPYIGKATRGLDGRKITAYLDLENPEVATFQHPDSGEWLHVEALPKKPPFGASEQDLARANKQIEDHCGFPDKRRYFAQIHPDFIPETRLVIGDASANARAGVQQQAHDEAQLKKREKRRRSEGTQRLHRQTGLSLDPDRFAGLSAEAKKSMQDIFVNTNAPAITEERGTR